MEIGKIRETVKKGQPPVQVYFSAGKGVSAEEKFAAFFQELKRSGGHFDFRDSFDGFKEEAPFLAFSASGSPRNYYKALASGLEEAPFLSLLRSLGSGAVTLSSDSEHALKILKRTITIRVLITPSCPYCAQVVELVNQIAVSGPQISAWIIDLDLFPDYVRRYRPKAAPTTILDEEVFLTGLIKEKELIEWLIKLDSNDYLDRLYRNDLTEKRMELAWQRLVHHPQDLTVIVELIRDEAFSIKLGAMALLEQVIDEIPDLHDNLFEALAPLLQDPSDLIVGDGAYLLGLLSDPRKIPLLQALLSHANPEIVEVAREGMKS